MLQNLSLPEGWHHVHLGETDSTMLDLRREPLADHAAPFVLVTTDYQTAGRGQRGTHWEATRGENLLFGIGCHPTFLRADRQFLLSEVTALAVAEVAGEEVTDIAVKWPNDVYHKDCKLCGMLLEHDLSGACIATTIIGVGLNVNQARFDSDAPNPVALRQVAGHTFDRAALMARIAARFDALYRRLAAGDAEAIHSAYLGRLYRREGLHPFADAAGRFEAEIVAVRPDGLLELRDSAGRRRTYAFKEVQFLTD